MSTEIKRRDHMLVIKDSPEDILEQIYQRLEKEYEYVGKEEQLNTLQEIMVTFSADGWPNIKKWYHGE